MEEQRCDSYLPSGTNTPIAIPVCEGAGAARVVINSRVTVCPLDSDRPIPETYQIVDPGEANPAERKISCASPVGRSLLGRVPGETVTVNAPGGIFNLYILDVDGVSVQPPEDKKTRRCQQG